MESVETLFEVGKDGWIHLTPFGEFPHRSGIVQVIDRRAAGEIVKSFDAKRESEGETFAGVLLDYDHFSMDTDKPSAAAGWIVGMEVRGDGLWGRVRWTDEGLKAVTGGRYRFVSPVFPPVAELEAVSGRPGCVRPNRLVSCALTNEPNIKGSKPVANRGTVEWEQETGGIPGWPVGGEGAKRYMWLLGETQSGTHCPVCAERHGKVKTLLEWMRMDAPYCKCRCRLAEVGKDIPEGFDPPRAVEDDAELVNRVESKLRGCLENTGWTDAAREVSLRVRRNKARVREILKDKPVGTTHQDESGVWIKREDDVELIRVPGTYVAGQNGGRFLTLLASGGRGDYFDPYSRGTASAMEHYGYVSHDRAEKMRNRAFVANRWSDAARIASAASRLARYGKMMGLKPWGSAARGASAGGSFKATLLSGGLTVTDKSTSGKKTPSKGRAALSGRKTPAPKAKRVPRDKSADVCFRCGGKGHWANECQADVDEAPRPVAADRKSRRAKEAYARAASLQARTGGYYPDGRPVIADIFPVDWAALKFPAIGPSAAIEARRKKYDEAFREYWAGVEKVGEGIGKFNFLVGMLGGVAGGFSAGGALSARGVPGRAGPLAKLSPDARATAVVEGGASLEGMRRAKEGEAKALAGELARLRGKEVGRYDAMVPPRMLREAIKMKGGDPDMIPGWAYPGKAAVSAALKSPWMLATARTARRRVLDGQRALKEVMLKNVPPDRGDYVGFLGQMREVAKQAWREAGVLDAAAGVAKRAYEGASGLTPARKEALRVRAGEAAAQAEHARKVAGTYIGQIAEVESAAGNYLNGLRQGNPLGVRRGDELLERLWKEAREEWAERSGYGKVAEPVE